MSKFKQFGILCLLSFCIVIGCFVFCRGFLLNRQVLTEKAKPCSRQLDLNHDNGNSNLSLPEVETGISRSPWCNTDPVFTRTIFLLVDALRYDFIHQMKFLSSINERGDKEISQNVIENTLHHVNTGTSSCAFKFIADPPTTTMQRLKALMSGTMPTFIDASANFNSNEVEEDNLIYQLNATGKRIAFLGDDTWLSLFPKSLFMSPYVEAHPSFNAWDLDTVDRAVNASIVRLLQPSYSCNWDILIAHLLGVDHCGHRFGPFHPEMKRKLAEADTIVEHIVNNMSHDTLLVIFGDHGMTKSGDHGGDSADEVEAALIFISKQLKRTRILHPPFHCNSKSKTPQVVSQIDLAPTLSVLLGLSIPLSSIGRIIPNFLVKTLYTDAISENVAQVAQYIGKYGTIFNSDLTEAYRLVEEARRDYNSKAQEDSSSRENLHQKCENYLSKVKDLAISTWTQFDIGYLCCGIGLFFFATISLILYIQFVHYQEPISGYVFLFSGGGLISVLVNFSLGSSFGLYGVILMTTSGLVLCIITTCLQNKSSNPRISTPMEVRMNCSDALSVVLYVLTCVSAFSNSYLINEGYVLGSVLMAASFLHIILHSFDSNSRKRRMNGSNKVKQRGILASKEILIWRNGIRTSWIGLFFLVTILRLGNLFFRCREELTDCQEEFLLHKHLASLPETWIVYKHVRFVIALLTLAIFVVTFREWVMSRKCKNSTRPAALIGKYMPTLLVVLTAAYWALEGLPFSIGLIPARNYFPWVYQTLTIVAMIIVWVDPLFCCGNSKAHENVESSERKFKLLGMYDRKRKISSFKTKKYDSSDFPTDFQKSFEKAKNYYFKGAVVDSSENSCNLDQSPSLLINSVLIILLLVQVSTTGITPAIIMIPYVITSILELTVSSSSQDSWSASILWTLASQYFFYASGHQTVFSTIPWDSAFLIGSTDSLGSSGAKSWINWIRPGLAVLGNLHVSQIIFTTTLPLLIYWKNYSMPDALLCRNKRLRVYALGGKFIILHAVKLLACMLSAAHHRRHLMVWKIFAPKLIFEIISFLVTLVSTICSLLFVTKVDYHYQKSILKKKQQLNQLLLL